MEPTAQASQPSQTITEYLVRDHERLHGLLQSSAARQTFDPLAFAEFRAGLLRHIAIEEKILFPAARNAQQGSPLSRARQLRVEHAALTSLMVPVPDVALCAEVEQLLSAHDAKEEGPDGVYAECESLLSRGQLIELGRKAAAFPPVRVAPHLNRPSCYRTAATALAAAERIRNS